MSQVRVGVIGVGSMGKNHARIYRSLDEADFIGVYDPDANVAKRICQQHGCQSFSSEEELLEQVEAISVAAPTSFHFTIAQKALHAGVNVLVEKPVTETTAEARELADLAKAKSKVLQVGHIERFNPVLKALEDRLTRARFIEAHRLSPYPGRSVDISVVMDLMIHDLEIILHLVKSPVQSVDAVGIPVLSKSEDIANARIRFENGCVANITTSRISPEKMRKIRVFQDDAYLSLDYQKQAGEIYRKSGDTISREKIAVEKDEPLKNQLASFIHCVATGGDPVVSGVHAAQALQLAAQISEEIAKGPVPDFAQAE
ncbi:MAG: Gfo/Idh/MocA family oxidoreductase [Verrucomicrobiota bacterium]